MNREISKIEVVLADLNEKYTAAMTEAQALQEEADIMQRRLVAADKLFSGLRSENERFVVLIYFLISIIVLEYA